MARHEVMKCTCPLCGADSSYYEIDYGERHYYQCPTCTKFIITERAEKHIRQSGGLPADFSTAAIDATKGNDHRVLEIRCGYGATEQAGFTLKVVDKADYPSI